MGRILLTVSAFLLAMAFIDPVATAQTTGKDSKGTEPKEMIFEGDLVEAQFLRPDQGVTEAIVRRKQSSLIKVRTDFVDEILKSAEDL